MDELGTPGEASLGRHEGPVQIGSNLADLGPAADARDAAAILDLLAAARRHPGAVGAAFPRRMVDDVWQTKRLFALPGGYAYGHRIYRRALPWSPEAIERTRVEVRVGRGLTLEHVIPVGLTLTAVKAAATSARIVEVLRRDLILAVITREQSRHLDELGLGRTHPNTLNPWARYAAAEITVMPFPGW